MLGLGLKLTRSNQWHLPAGSPLFVLWNLATVNPWQLELANWENWS